MDINEGPLERAKEHIALYGLQAYIQTLRRCGGKTRRGGSCPHRQHGRRTGHAYLKKQGKVCQSTRKNSILEPQSEIENVRGFFREEGYAILAETWCWKMENSIR